MILNNKNKYILEATLNYTKNSERFSGSLFEWFFFFFVLYFFLWVLPHESFIYSIVLFFVLLIDLWLFFNILFSPNKQNVVGALLHVFLFIFIFVKHHYYRKKKKKSNFAKYLLIFLLKNLTAFFENTSQYSCAPRIVSVLLHNTFQHFCRKFL